MFEISELVNILDSIDSLDVMTEEDYLNALELAGSNP